MEGMMAEPRELVETENAQVGYQVAVGIWTFQGQMNWNRFNVILVANSVIIAVISAKRSGADPLPPLIVSLAILGIILCIAWVLITARGFAYLTYWFRCATELERHLGDGIRTTSRFL
jgi:hypothetical protein